MKSIKSIIIFFAIVVFMLVTYIIVGGFFEPKVYNIMVKNFVATRKGSDGIVLIVIDDKSIERYRWPWKRSLYSNIFEYLGNYTNAKIIGFDAVVTTPDLTNPSADLELYNTVNKLNNFVGGFAPLSAEYQDKKAGANYDKAFDEKFSINIKNKSKMQKRQRFHSLSKYPQPYFDALKHNGSVWVLTHPVDGFIKDIPQLVEYRGNLYPSLGLSMFAKLNKTKNITLTDNYLTIDGEENLKIQIHRRFGGIFNYLHFYRLFKNSDYSHKTYSAVDIIDSIELIKKGKKPIISPSNFDNKIVFVGANAKASGLGLEDTLPTPVNSNHPGVDIQATNLDNLIHNTTLKSISAFPEFLINFFLILAAFFIVSQYSLFASLGIITLMIVAYIFLGVLSYKLNYAIPIITPVSMQLITMIFAYSHKFVVEARNKEKIKIAMGKYISQVIMQNVVKDIDNVTLGGKKSVVTVLFADIRGFTSMSEKLLPEEISVILNEYFTEIEPIITRHNGIINKFIGDAVLAIFGEPIQNKDHALNAVKCADDMLKKVSELQEKWMKEGKPKIEIGVGINTGEAFVGNIGSEKRMEYTVIGDTVNLASRIESYNKVYKTQFLISNSTYANVKGIADVIKISEVKIRGKAKKMNIYEVLRLIQ